MLETTISLCHYSICILGFSQAVLSSLNIGVEKMNYGTIPGMGLISYSM